MRFALTLACLLFVSTSFAADGILSNLVVGQNISLKETPHGYQIMVLPGGGVHKITKIATDYLVVEDALGINEIRIPIYAIRSISTIKLPK